MSPHAQRNLVYRTSHATHHRRHGITLLCMMTLLWTALSVPSVQASQSCSATAHAVLKACYFSAADDYWITIGSCLNESDRQDARDCRIDARQSLLEERDLCNEQRSARLDLCERVGQDPYDPDFEPADFTTDFTNLNPYWPLAVGNAWTYVGGDETIDVEVVDATKSIEGVTCIVVRDLVTEDGDAIEFTDDWYGQAANGDVYYCGEISENYELFPGDDPAVPELVDIDGSWKTGRDDAKPGILMLAAPQVGAVYRQEVALGDAEDAAEVLSSDYSFGEDPELDQFVPQALADLLCDNDCVVTLEFTPIDPEVAEHKFYAPGIGLFLEVDLTTGETAQLVDCNLDPICASLPAP